MDFSIFISSIINNSKDRDLFYITFRNLIFDESRNFWKIRCNRQKDKERLRNINLRRIKDNLNDSLTDFIDINRKVNVNNLYTNLDSLRSNIYFGTNMQGFIVLVNYALFFFVFMRD